MLTGLLAPLAAPFSPSPLAALAATATSSRFSLLAPLVAALPTTWDSAGNATRALGPVLPALDTIRRFYDKSCATLTKS
jgi:hypothetical protein